MTEKSMCRYLFTLIKLAEMGAHKRVAKISTEYLAGKLGASQQTASRYLIELDNMGWIKRTVTPEGCLIKITDVGFKELQKLYSNLRFLIEAAYPPSITLEGTVFTGLGEGAYYISLESYRKQ
jgi:riboflavin kinase